jgi:hypothetical protein
MTLAQICAFDVGAIAAPDWKRTVFGNFTFGRPVLRSGSKAP